MTISWSPKFGAGPSRNRRESIGEDLQLGTSWSIWGSSVSTESSERGGGLRDAASAKGGGRGLEPKDQGRVGHWATGSCHAQTIGGPRASQGHEVTLRFHWVLVHYFSTAVLILGV